MSDDYFSMPVDEIPDGLPPPRWKRKIQVTKRVEKRLLWTIFGKKILAGRWLRARKAEEGQ